MTTRNVILEYELCQRGLAGVSEWRQVYLERKRNLSQETTKFTAAFQQNYLGHNNKPITAQQIC